MNSIAEKWHNREIRGTFFLCSELRGELEEKEIDSLYRYFNTLHDVWIRCFKPSKSITTLFRFTQHESDETLFVIKMIHISSTGHEEIVAQKDIRLCASGFELPA